MKHLYSTETPAQSKYTDLNLKKRTVNSYIYYVLRYSLEVWELNNFEDSGKGKQNL